MRLIKLLHSQQGALGVVIRSAKDSIVLDPMPPGELGRACTKALAAALLARGWAALGEDHLLGSSLLGLADGAAHTVDSVQLRADAAADDPAATAVTLLVQAGAFARLTWCCALDVLQYHGRALLQHAAT